MLLPIKEYMNEDGLANVNHKGYLDPKTWENYQARFLSLQDYNGNNDLISELISGELVKKVLSVNTALELEPKT